MLTRVTITGADDATDPARLVAMSIEFPFVEWGILMSSSRYGTPRWPSLAWREHLAKERTAKRFERVDLAAHFCGTVARETIDGHDAWVDQIGPMYHRVQLNGFYPWKPGHVIGLASRHPGTEFILQTRSEDELMEVSRIAVRMPRGSALFDPSGGRGIEAFSWPRAPAGLSMGYAGGIKPETVVDALREIGPVDAAFWIDMESGVRTDERFDLGRVRDVLTLAAPHVASARPTTGAKSGEGAK